MSGSPPASASDAIDSRQSERLVHTEPAHSSVVGGPSSLSRIATAAMTIAAIPMPIAAMNQFLRTGAESSAIPAAAAVDVKPDVPSQTVLDAIAEHRPDRILVAVREGEDATWLETDELDRVPGQIAGVPVTRVAI